MTSSIVWAMNYRMSEWRTELAQAIPSEEDNARSELNIPKNNENPRQHFAA